ncbi:MAG: hypothetical protein WCP20_18510 [Desulfuromonadales bacterium]
MGAITKVVIDTNVFISAFGWDGKPEAVLSLMEQRKVVNCEIISLINPGDKEF